jgi:chorismate mutase
MPGGTFAAYVAGGLDPTPNIAANGYVDSGGTWRYINSRAASWYIQNGGMHAWYTAPSGTAGNAISFTQAMTLDASGNLLVGTTSGPTNARFVTRHSVSNAGVAFIQSGSSAYTDSVLTVSCDTSAGTGFNILRLQALAGTVCQVLGNGNIQNTNNSYGAISDENIKENIVDATPKLQDLLAVKIRNFNIKGDSAKQIGVVAQELEEVFPAMIEENTDGLKGVKYSVFVPILVKAIQELSAELNELKQRIH